MKPKRLVKVVHLTSVHQRYDTRIFLKECISLKKKYNVFLVVADGKGDEVKDGVQICDVGKPTGRFNRILHATRRVYMKASEIDADIYHAHDPELIPVLKRLKRKGKVVIYDAHEDFPKQILTKPYLNSLVARAFSYTATYIEKIACKNLSCIVAATPFIQVKFIKINRSTTNVNNYPILNELFIDNFHGKTKKNQICYIGGIAKIRGICSNITAFQYAKSKYKLKIAGNFQCANFENHVKSLDTSHVDFLGFLDRNELKSLLSQCVAGLVTLHPTINYLDSLPVKMFEYMAAGIPVIASNFPLWKKIVEGGNCGICVDPLDPKEIASAIDYLIENSDKAEEMGRNGRRLVENQYNWSVEEKKLLALYDDLSLNKTYTEQSIEV